MAIAKTTFSDPQVETFVIAKVNDVPGRTKKTLSFPDGTVASVQPPNGIMDIRPAGTSGDYELCDIDGNVATFEPVKGQGYFTKAFVRVSG